MLYLLRHGEIVHSAEKRYIGQTDVPLSSKGLQQAAWWKKELSRVDFERVYASDLVRALETAKGVADLPESNIHIMPQLREIHLGDWEGQAMQSIKLGFRTPGRNGADAWTALRYPRAKVFRNFTTG